MKFFKIFLACVFTINAFASDLSFTKERKTYFNISQKDLISGEITIKNQKIKSETIKIYDVVRKKEISYVGYPFYQLLDLVYGSNWRKAYKLHFIATDGYRVSSKIKELFLNEVGLVGYLAYKEEKSDGFSLYRKGKRDIKLGPYYLVWHGLSAQSKKKFLKTHKWPYQLKTINLKSSK